MFGVNIVPKDPANFAVPIRSYRSCGKLWKRKYTLQIHLRKQQRATRNVSFWCRDRSRCPCIVSQVASRKTDRAIVSCGSGQIRTTYETWRRNKIYLRLVRLLPRLLYQSPTLLSELYHPPRKQDVYARNSIASSKKLWILCWRCGHRKYPTFENYNYFSVNHSRHMRYEGCHPPLQIRKYRLHRSLIWD